MTEVVPLNPELYSINGIFEQSNRPSLKGCRCKCGYVFFPRHQFGCEKCGRTNEDIKDIEIAGKGKLRAFATVHKHHSKNLKTPFVVATIILDDGCAIRAMLDVKNDKNLTPGQTVYSSFIEVGEDDSGSKIVDLRFKP